MIRFALVCLLSLAQAGVSAQPVSVEGVRFEPTVDVGGQPLVLNGAGLRKKLFFKVYAAGLYVPEKSGDPKVLLAQTGPRRVLIAMLRNVDADTFAEALLEGLKANHTEQQLAALRPQIDQLVATFKAIGEAKKGDSIQLDWVPETGTRIVVNGEPRGDAIAGATFFSALLRVWLGDEPADAALKRAMLGA
jgi:Chalcone isomerase-like